MKQEGKAMHFHTSIDDRRRERLRLRRETLRCLDPRQLLAARGGVELDEKITKACLLTTTSMECPHLIEIH